MTTPAAVTAKPAAPPQTPAWTDWSAKINARTNALSAAVIAIARHITGTPAGSEHDALAALGISPDDADLIVSK